MGKMLDILKAKQSDLLLGEVAALLHNLGKLSDRFIINQLEGRNDYNAFQVAPPNADFIRITEDAKNELAQNPQKRVWEELTIAQQDLLLRVGHSEQKLLNEAYTLIEILSLWSIRRLDRNGVFKEGSRWIDGLKTGYLLWLLNICHKVAQVDKDQGTNVPNQHGQRVWISTAFGYEEEPIERDSLGKRLAEFDFSALTQDAIHARNIIKMEAKKHFPHAIADTQHPINEITLWDWSWSVAALYKSALAQLVIEQKPIGSIKKSHLRWRTLRVTVDVLGLLAKAHRIPDVLGYDRIIQAGFDRVKELIEVTYVLGNEIYRDSTGIYFTFPGVCVHLSSQIVEDLCLKIHDVMTGGENEELAPEIDFGASWGERSDEQWAYAPRMLAHPLQASKNSILSGSSASYINWESLAKKSNQQEICPICGIRFYQKKVNGKYRQQSCIRCKKRAGELKDKWEKEKTNWLDEIADGHDRVALIVGRFDLSKWLDATMIETLYNGEIDQNGVTRKVTKRVSPARIMRVWRTTEEFWKESVQKLMSGRCSDTKDARFQRQNVLIEWQSFAPDKGSVLDGTVDNHPISFYVLEDGSCLTIMNHQLHNLTFRQNLKVSVLDDNSINYLGIISEVLVPPADIATYQPTRTILTTPDQFMALVPGEDALHIAQKITEQYGIEMGKVRSRLPLDLSIVYFHRKMPLYAAMDAARRFLTTNYEQSPEKTEWVLCKDANSVSGTTQLCFTNNCKWNIQTQFGDGTKDMFYPYVARLCPKESDAIDYKSNGDKYIHIDKLEKDDVIKVAPSHFSYLWLDNTTRRYSIGDEEEEDAPFSTQGMYLEEIEWHIETWQKLKEAQKKGNMTDTKLHGVIQLLLEKRSVWGKDKTFADFAEDVLIRNGLDKVGITKEDVVSDRLFRCFDLHYRIMKQKLTPPKEEAHT